jgi:hypothetical protein
VILGDISLVDLGFQHSTIFFKSTCRMILSDALKDAPGMPFKIPLSSYIMLHPHSISKIFRQR